MSAVVTFVAGIALGTLSASCVAASFDCIKASTAVEHRICDDPGISRQDEALSKAYRDAQQTLSGAQREALRADQSAWIALRDQCTNAACLRQRYTERLTVLRTAGRPFAWNGHWWRVDASGNRGATLTLNPPARNDHLRADSGIVFHLNATAGANQGELSGTAIVNANLDHAVFHGTASNGSGCELNFRRMENRIEVTQDGGDSACEAGHGVFYSGTYVASENDPNSAPTLLTRGVFSTPEQDTAFHTLVGRDYEAFVATADVVAAEASHMDQHAVTRVDMFVRGIACNTKSIILFDSQAHQWAAVWQVRAGGNGVDLRYYTNVDTDKQALPDAIASQRAACPGDTVHVQLPR